MIHLFFRPNTRYEQKYKYGPVTIITIKNETTGYNGRSHGEENYIPTLAGNPLFYHPLSTNQTNRFDTYLSKACEKISEYASNIEGQLS
jgi:hypothetical protein